MGGLTVDDRVTCSGCKNFGRAPHASPELRADFQYFHRQPAYRPPKGCKLTGEHLAPDRLRRCEKFESTEG
jgi:hypothetical protein